MAAYENPNIINDPTITVFRIVGASLNLLFALFVIQFYLRHPETRKKFGNFFVVVLILKVINTLCFTITKIFAGDLSKVYYEVEHL